MIVSKFKEGNKASKGRPKGSPNKRTLEFQAVLAKHDFCPASAMIEIFNEAKKIYANYALIYDAICEAKANEAGYPVPTEDKADKYLRIAGDMAREISSYAYAKRKAIEQTIDPQLLEAVKACEGKTEKELLEILNQNKLA